MLVLARRINSLLTITCPDGEQIKVKIRDVYNDEVHVDCNALKRVQIMQVNQMLPIPRNRGRPIELWILEIRNNIEVRLGFVAPKNVNIVREEAVIQKEIHENVARQNER